MKNIKSLGQNWLKNREILDNIAMLSLPDNSQIETCLEIGPGLGTLTSSLLRVYPEVIAVEFDENLAKNLPKSFPGKNLVVYNEDFLKFDLSSIKKPYVVAANIPYYITSPIIHKLITAENKPIRTVLLIQKEVAERIAALDGKQSLLSLEVQNFAKVTLGPVVGREYFTPAPKVDSQVIILDPKAEPEISPRIIEELARIGFSSPRKKLISNLAVPKMGLSKEQLTKVFREISLDLNVRPADLSLKDWDNLAILLAKK